MPDLFNFNPIERDQTIDEAFTGINTNFDEINSAFDNVQSDLDLIAAALNSGVVYRPILNTQANDGDTVFLTSYSYVTGSNSILVFSGGLHQIKGVHWSETDNTTITFTTPRVAGERILVIQLYVGSAAILNLEGLNTTTEVPAGAIDSTDGVNGNGDYTLAHNIAAATIPEVVISGFLRLSPNLHYSWTGNVITILPGYKPAIGETIQVVYQWSV